MGEGMPPGGGGGISGDPELPLLFAASSSAAEISSECLGDTMPASDGDLVKSNGVVVVVGAAAASFFAPGDFCW